MGTFVGISGLVIIAAAFFQAAFGIQTVVSRTFRAARLDRERLVLFRARAETVLRQVQADRERHELSWNGKRKFQVEHREYETPNEDICSFYLVPHDKRPVPPYLPGQFLTFELPVPGQPRPVVRCYSLSDCSSERQCYRVTIKKLGPPPDAPEGTLPGISSNYFHDRLQQGDIVEVLAPAGEFYLDRESERPVVLIAGGVGLTPLISMLNALITSESNREIWFFYGVRNRGEHAMYDHLQRLSKETPNLRTVIAYSEPTGACTKGVDYDVDGFVSVQLMKSMLKSTNYEFYICGPPPMMDSLTGDLEDWGVPLDDIKFEAFGPASVRRDDDQATGEAEQSFQVEFSRSNSAAQWTPKIDTLLELAEAHGIKARFGCRAGSCGTCLTALMQGEVEYLHRPGKEPEAGSCLTCIARPKTNLVLDL